MSGVAAPSSPEGLSARRRVMWAASLFVMGFALVFTILGAGASFAGSMLLRERELLIRVAGFVVIGMGLAAAGLLRFPWLYREARIDMRRVKPGLGGALPLGMAFAAGWTPCIGPVLAGILTAAASIGNAAVGAALLFTYSLGLGIPFLLLARGVGSEGRVNAWLRRHGHAIELGGGVFLIGMGLLMVTGVWLSLFTPIIRLFSRTGWPPL